MKKTLLAASFILVTGLAFYSLHTSVAAPSELFGKSPKKEANVHGIYSMMLPTYLTKDSTLNNEASLQYANLIREVYIIVIDEPKKEFQDIYMEINDYDTTQTVLENYAAQQLISIKANLSRVTNMSEKKTVATGCGNAIVYDVSGFQDGIDEEMAFTVAFAEGKLNLYFIMTWTFAKTKAEYQGDMNEMIVSFKELSGEINTHPNDVVVGNMFIRLPRSMYEDTSLTANSTLEFADYTAELYIDILEADRVEWQNSFNEWGKKEYPTLIDFFAGYQKNEGNKSMPVGTTSTEITKSKQKLMQCRSYSFQTNASPDDDAWYFGYRAVEGKKKLYLIEIYTPVEKRSENQPTIDRMLSSFNEL